jgi:chromosome segregation ATPase
MSRSLRKLLTASLVLSLASFSWTVNVSDSFGAAAKQNPKGLTDDIKRAEREIGQARDKLQAARKQAEDAKGEMRKAAAAFEKATNHAGDVRRKVEQEHDAAPPLVAARQQLQSTQAQLDELSRPILEKLRESPEYAAAIQKRDALKLKLSTAPVDDRESLGKEYAASLAAVRSLESSAILANSQAKSVKEKVAEAEQKVQTLMTKRNESIERDSRMAEVRRELEKVKGEVAKARQKLETESKQLADAERKVHSEEQDKQRLQQKQKQAKNNNNKKKKK